MEKESVVQLCSEIRETLENLVEKWGSSLSDQDIQVPTDVPAYHDGIDNVIQSIDAIRCKVLRCKVFRMKRTDKQLHVYSTLSRERTLVY